MIALPRRDAVKRTAEERKARAAWLRLVLGPVERWPDDWRVLQRERVAIAELDGGLDPATAEREGSDAVRSSLLGRIP